MMRSRVAYVGSPEMLGKQLRPVMKEALQEGGRHWHRVMLPRHFQKGAASRYGYQKRAAFYQIKKRRIVRHGRPLEFRGDMKREVLGRRVITGTSKTARVKLKGPKYLFQYRKDLRQPDKAAELTTVTRGEEAVLARVIRDEGERLLAAVRTTETVQVGV